MVSTPVTPLAKRALIIVRSNQGASARLIERETGIPRRTIGDILKRYRETGSFEPGKSSGRPRKTSSRDDRKIISICQRNRRLTAPMIAKELNFGLEENHKVSVSTVKRRLNERGLYGRVAAKKPFITAENQVKRMEWALEHRHWTSREWEKVLWSDESKFEIFGTKRRVFVRRTAKERYSPECLVPSVKHGGGSVMVWGCSGALTTGLLTRIDGIMKKEEYLDILKNDMLPSGQAIFGRTRFVFQQDNDSKHTAHVCQNYLRSLVRKGKIKVMTWPPQSPDLNPIELLWEQLDRNVRKDPPTSKGALWNALRAEWSKIEDDVLKKLTDRMPRICEAVIKANGNHIDFKCFQLFSNEDLEIFVDIVTKLFPNVEELSLLEERLEEKSMASAFISK